MKIIWSYMIVAVAHFCIISQIDINEIQMAAQGGNILLHRPQRIECNRNDVIIISTSRIITKILVEYFPMWLKQKEDAFVAK